MELQEALSQIDSIRTQITRAETFRGYRSLTVGFSGVLALATAAVHSVWLRDAEQSGHAFVWLWVSVAAVSVAVIGGELAIRCFRQRSSLTTFGTQRAIELFLPCLVAGALVTAVLVQLGDESMELLPGLWSVLFSLGVFSSCRYLPKPVVWVGFYYLLAGTAVMMIGHGESAFSPMTMAATFGIGQLALAVILYFELERNDDACERQN